MTSLFLVAAGGAAGSVLRYLVGLWTMRALGAAFPWGTLLINISGSFVIGLVSEIIARRFADSPELRLLLMTGFLGGFTTFSAFSLETLALFERGETQAALVYVAASVVVGLAAVAGGATLARAAF